MRVILMKTRLFSIAAPAGPMARSRRSPTASKSHVLLRVLPKASQRSICRCSTCSTVAKAWGAPAREGTRREPFNGCRTIMWFTTRASCTRPRIQKAAPLRTFARYAERTLMLFYRYLRVNFDVSVSSNSLCLPSSSFCPSELFLDPFLRRPRLVLNIETLEFLFYRTA